MRSNLTVVGGKDGKIELTVGVSKLNICPIPTFTLFDLADIHPVVEAHV